MNQIQLQTLPFFGSGKAIWFKGCSMAEERVATKDVGESLAMVVGVLKDFAWQHVRLVISAGKVDKRKVFYKAMDKLGRVESFAGWSVDDRDWADQAETWARKSLQARQKEITDEAMAELINRVGPNARQLENEIEKVALYAGERREIGFADVAAVCTRNKAARAFALGAALGDRDLPAVLARLDEALWEVKLDPQKSRARNRSKRRDTTRLARTHGPNGSPIESASPRSANGVRAAIGRSQPEIQRQWIRLRSDRRRVSRGRSPNPP